MKFREQSKQEDARWLNNATFLHYMNDLKLKALTMFEWQGLPNNIPGRFIEQVLFEYGLGGVIDDPTKGLIFTRCTPSGMVNIYDEAISYRCFSTNGLINKDVKADDIVLCRNNYLNIPTYNAIILFASRLTKVERTLDVNINALKIPVIVKCKESQRLVMKNLMQQYDGNVPYIYGEKDLDTDSIAIFDLKVPYLADKLMMYKHEVMNDARTYLGLDNANTDKKERLIVDEVNSNNDAIELSAEVMLSARQDAAKMLNERFGLNVTVTMRGGAEEFDEDPEEPEDEPVEESEE